MALDPGLLCKEKSNSSSSSHRSRAVDCPDPPTVLLRSCMSCSGHIRPARPRTGTVAAPITICLSVLVTPPPLQAPDSGVNASLDSNKPTRCSSKTQRFLYLYSSLGSFGARPEITQITPSHPTANPSRSQRTVAGGARQCCTRLASKNSNSRQNSSRAPCHFEILCGGVIYAAVLSTQYFVYSQRKLTRSRVFG